MRVLLINVLALTALLPVSSSCNERPMKTEKTISEIQSQIAIGMPREQVEDRVAKIPGVSSVYTPREHIFPPEERISAGVSLSGRLTVSTPLEVTGLEKASGHVVIEFDDQDRVVKIRVGGFGFKKSQ